MCRSLELGGVWIDLYLRLTHLQKPRTYREYIPFKVDLFSFIPAILPICPWKTAEMKGSENKTGPHRHSSECEIVVSMEMACDGKSYHQISGIDSHWRYLTFTDEKASIHAKELIKPPCSGYYNWCLYHQETTLTTACLQMILLSYRCIALPPLSFK